jgi:hypothetical protein
MTRLPYVDIVLVKQQVDAGRLRTKVDMFGNIYLEDTIAGESVKIGAIPEGSIFISDTHKNTWKAEWLPDYDTFVNDNGYESEPIQISWMCSRCGKASFVRTDWCTCGADMRGD